MPMDNATTVRQAIEKLDHNMLQSMRLPSVGQLMGGIGRGIGGVAGIAGNPTAAAGAMMTATTQVVIALSRLPTELHRFADSVVNSYHGLAEVSGSMAAVMARNDIENTMRDVRRGNLLAQSADSLIQANQRLKDRMLGLEVTIEKISNKMLENVINIIDQMVQKIADNPQIVDFASKAKQWLQENWVFPMQDFLRKFGINIDGIQGAQEAMASPTSMTNFLQDVAKDVEDARQRNSPRFRRATGFGAAHPED